MFTDRDWARFTMGLLDGALHLLGRLQARLYRLTEGRLGGRFAQEPVLVITTTGRKTGKPRTTTVLYGHHGEELVVIASNRGGDRPSAWAFQPARPP
jgi:F420H(2)-dependent quinone reductase